MGTLMWMFCFNSVCSYGLYQPNIIIYFHVLTSLLFTICFLTTLKCLPGCKVSPPQELAAERSEAASRVIKRRKSQFVPFTFMGSLPCNVMVCSSLCNSTHTWGRRNSLLGIQSMFLSLLESFFKKFKKWLFMIANFDKWRQLGPICLSIPM